MEVKRLPTVIADGQGLTRLVDRYLSRGLPFSFDLETTGLNPRSDLIVCMIFKQQGFYPVIVDTRHFNFNKEVVAPLFDGKMLIIGQNLKFDWKFMAHHLDIRMPRMYDIMLAEKVLDGGYSENKKFDLPHIAERYGFDVSKEERKWFPQLNEREEWYQPFPEEQLMYCCQDVEIPEQVRTLQLPKLKEMGTSNVMKLETELLPVVAEMEYNGIKLDEEGWVGFQARKAEEARALENEVIKEFAPAIIRSRLRIYDAEVAVLREWEAERDAEISRLRGDWESDPDPNKPGWGDFKVCMMQIWREKHPHPKALRFTTENVESPKYIEKVNVNSPDQMKIAFRELRIPARSCKEEDLKMLEDDWPCIKLYGQYKKKEKMANWRLPDFVDPVDHRIHTSFNQIIDTGRFSSSDPNVQQIPSKGPDGKEARSYIVAEPGWKLIVNDYPGIEERILCYLANDTEMRKGFDEGVDSHSITARSLFNLPDDANVREPRPELGGASHRDAAKTLKYGLAYGLMLKRFAKKMRMTIEQATPVYNGFFELYRATADYLERARKSAMENLVSRTILGRPRYFTAPPKPVTWRDKRDYEFAMQRIGRQGANAEIQGTSADITKYALVLLRRKLPSHVRIILTVHDEILLEARDEYAEMAAEILGDCMEEAANFFLKGFPVPCRGKAIISDHWVKE